MKLTLLMDTREPELNFHPWSPFFPESVTIERATLETGDFVLKGFEEAAVVERKAVSDLLACMGAGRERFERELARGRYAGRFIVVIEGTLQGCFHKSRGLHPNSIVGSLAAWQRRFCPFMFCGSPELAAQFAMRFLSGQAKEIMAQADTLAAQQPGSASGTARVKAS